MSKIPRTDDYAVYQTYLGESQEPKESEKDQLFAKILKIFGGKQDKDLNINLIRKVFKLMLINSSILIRWEQYSSKHHFEIL